MIIITNDCITTKDGKTLCWDRDCKKYYLFSKQEVSLGDLDKEDLSKLVEMLGKKGDLI